MEKKKIKIMYYFFVVLLSILISLMMIFMFLKPFSNIIS